MVEYGPATQGSGIPASPNFWDHNIRQHGMTNKSSQILQGGQVRGNFLRAPPCSWHSDRAWRGQKFV